MTFAFKKSIKQLSDTKKKYHPTEKRSSPEPTADTASNNQDHVLNGIGSYEFIKPLGSGRFSKVMLAYHLETQQQVAIKIIDKQAHEYRVMSRLVREISLMETLQHDNIVKLVETFESCDSLFIVMEYVPGWNLDEYLQKTSNGALNEQEARHLFRQLVLAVDYCHRKWIVHRDLKTPNILITPNGNVKLADFGLGNRYGLQRLRTICGSMLYYGPEIITGQKYNGPEVDCWCLGITLFRMTAGFEPFSHARTVGELKRDVCRGNYPMPSSLSPELQVTIKKCLQLERRNRMSLLQVLKDDPWLTDSGTLPCPVSGIPRSTFEETMGEDTENRDEVMRTQFMRDLERETHVSSKVRKTVIYHPINQSTYYTTKVGSLHSVAAEKLQNVELLRSELLQSIRSRARRLGIKSTDRWELRTPGLKSLFSSFNLQQKKKDEAPTSSSSTTSTNRSIADIVQRITKDQVYHFQLMSQTLPNNSQSSRPPSLTLSTSSSSLSSIIANDNALAAFEEDQEKKNVREVMTLLKQTCQLMGITYLQDSPSTLQCVLTLRNAPKKSIKQSCHRPDHQRKQSQASSVGTNMDELALPTRQSKRLSLPLLSHLTSSMTTSFFGRNKPRHSMDECATIVTQPKEHIKQKEGMAIFTIEIENHKKKNDRLGVRFSKQQGSTTVFKMAGGWVAGVMALDGKLGR